MTKPKDNAFGWTNYLYRRTSYSLSNSIISFLMGAVFVLFVFFLYYLNLPIVFFVLTSFIFLVLFLLFVVLISRPARISRIVRKEPFLKKVSEEEIKNKDSVEKNFIGSSETKTYHKINCRFAKLIKPRFRDYSADDSFFKKRKYKACKICIKNN